MSVKVLVAVAVGGALGAVGRYVLTGVVGQWAGHGFPWGTMAVNLIGSFVLGVLVEAMALLWSPGEVVRAFLVVGFVGAFTTFSAFSMDIHVLMTRDQFIPAVAYVMISVVVGLGALLGGMAMFRQAAGPFADG